MAGKQRLSGVLGEHINERFGSLLEQGFIVRWLKLQRFCFEKFGLQQRRSSIATWQLGNFGDGDFRLGEGCCEFLLQFGLLGRIGDLSAIEFASGFVDPFEYRDGLIEQQVRVTGI